MEELKKLDRVDLIDQLAEYTTVFSRLFNEKKKNTEYQLAKEMIKLLTEELEARETIDIVATNF
jgi:hypothetical protein